MIEPVEDEVRLVFDRLRLREPEWWELNPATRGIIRSSCLTKTIMSMDRVRDVARRARRGGTPLRGYRCPFARVPHHHLGRVPTMETVEKIALAIRDLHGDRPEESPNRG